MYQKEGILVNDVPKAKFVLYQQPKTVEDNSEIFPNVARILDTIL